MSDYYQVTKAVIFRIDEVDLIACHFLDGFVDHVIDMIDFIHLNQINVAQVIHYIINLFINYRVDYKQLYLKLFRQEENKKMVIQVLVKGTAKEVVKINID